MSSSPMQITANRQNAALSTGPRSESGKQASSQNRTSHGLTARRAVLQNESQADFDALLDAMIADYKPATIVERQLCFEIAENSWRLKRAAGLETDLLDRAPDFLSVSDDLDKIRRYRTSIERAWHKAIEQLARLQAARCKQQPPPPKPKTSTVDDLLKGYLYAPAPSAAPHQIEPEEAPEEEIGFVPQSLPQAA